MTSHDGISLFEDDIYFPKCLIVLETVLIIDLIILYVDMRITAILIAVILLLDVLKNNLWYL